MKQFFDGDGEDAPLRIIPSGDPGREELWREFRKMKRILWGELALAGLTLGAVVLFSGDRERIVALTSDGRMQALLPLSDQAYEKNFEKIVRFFVTSFLGNLTAYDSFEISIRLEKALSVMTPGLRSQMKKEILSQNLIDAVGRARIHTVLSVRSLALHRVTSGVWSVEVQGVRSTYAYGQGTPRVQSFSARLLLRKGAPTAFNPYGLWISRYQEKIDAPRPDGQP